MCYFVEVLDQPQPEISRHLACLRGAGIVEARRDGKWMHYRMLMPPNIGAAQVLKQALSWLKHESQMQADRSASFHKCAALPPSSPPFRARPCQCPSGGGHQTRHDVFGIIGSPTLQPKRLPELVEVLDDPVHTKLAR